MIFIYNMAFGIAGGLLDDVCFGAMKLLQNGMLTWHESL